MVRWFGSNSVHIVTTAEAASVEQLCSSHRELLMDGDLADVRSEAGYAACAAFLNDIDRAARQMCLPIESRGYRSGFSANYRALFPDNARLYRVDVLETSLDQHSEIWVNGDKFELSPEAVGRGEQLQQAWADLGTLLRRWHASRGHDDRNLQQRPARAELATALVALDIAWARFECTYISELIAIEDRARQLVVRAATLAGLSRGEGRKGSLNCEAAERELVQFIARLNSVANFKCKGRDDLGYDILASARAVVARCGPAPLTPRKDAACLLARDVIASYDAMRDYLREVGGCMERVDPHLCNNPGLVSRLVDWETSWEVGARYVRDVPLLDAICDLVAEIKAAQNVAPELTAMCEDCDVELFLVLPRIVLLFFVADPAKHRAGLVRNLLPHRFSSGLDGRPSELKVELLALINQFTVALSALASADDELRGSGGEARGAAWRALLKRAIAGDADGSVQGSSPAVMKTLEAFMHELECWSLELQRHCPQDWNQVSAVLVQCITGGAQKMSSAKFQV